MRKRKLAQTHARRGRPAIPVEQRRRRKLWFYVNDEHHDVIYRRAAEQHIPVAAMLRSIVLTACIPAASEQAGS
jgi:hypothetical protein